MEVIIYNPKPKQQHYRDNKTKAWEVKFSTCHINQYFHRN